MQEFLQVFLKVSLSIEMKENKKVQKVCMRVAKVLASTEMTLQSPNGWWWTNAHTTRDGQNKSKK